MIKHAFLFLLFILCVVSAALAQQPDYGADLQRAELKKLENMVGTWEGSGWFQMGKERETFQGTEIIQRKLDGVALLVEGKFKNPEGKVIHETLAVISYDTKQKIHRFRTYLANGSTGGDHVIKLLPDGWEWGFEVPGGTMRYTIKTTAGTWNEIGEFSRDGKTWLKFFEMNLKKRN